MQVIALSPFGVQLVGFDAANDAHVAEFADAFRKHSFVRFNDPGLTPERHVQLMARIGTVAADRPGAGPVGMLAHDPEKYQGFDPTNSNPGKFDDGELLFHFDFAFNDDWPCHAISLFSVELPPSGGDTLFVHGAQVHARLSDELKAAVAGRKAIHLFDPYRTNGAIRTREAMLGRYPERGMHDIVWPHPQDGSPVLMVALSSVDRIVGLPSEESEALLNQLFAHLYDPANILRHKWTLGDFVVWDNHVIQHSREHFDRRLRRTLRRVINGDEVAIQRRVTRWKLQQPIDGTAAA
jgi:taurine dioxygenase